MNMGWLKPKRQVPTPEGTPVHSSPNPYFKPEGEEWNKFRKKVLGITAIVIGVIVLGLWVYGPWLTIDQVEVKGTVLVKPDSVVKAANKYLDGYRWLVLPNRQIAVLSDQGMAKYLTKLISQRLSIEGVDITHVGQHKIILTVRERTPLFRWSASTQLGLLDRHGVIVGSATGSWDNIPLVVDENNKLFQPDNKVLEEDVVTAMSVINEAMIKNKVSVKELIIPIPTCLSEFKVEPVVTNTNASVNNNSNSNKNTNNDSDAENDNVNGNINALAGEPEPVCDKEALKRQSAEIDVQIDKGPRVMFDRYTDLNTAVKTLGKLLAEKENSSAKYIDMRFVERVYIR